MPVDIVEDVEGLNGVLKDNQFVVLDCFAKWCEYPFLGSAAHRHVASAAFIALNELV